MKHSIIPITTYVYLSTVRFLGKLGIHPIDHVVQCIMIQVCPRVQNDLAQEWGRE